MAPSVSRATLVRLALIAGASGPILSACSKRSDPAAPDAGSAAPVSATTADAGYRARWLELHEAQTDVLALAGRDCTAMATALQAFNLSDKGRALREIDSQKDPEGEQPFVGADKVRFDGIKRVLAGSLQLCGDDPAFISAFNAGGPGAGSAPEGEWVLYRDEHFEARFMRQPEHDKRHDPHKDTAAATLTWEQGMQAAAWYDLHSLDSYDCDKVIDADVGNFTSRCSVKKSRTVQVDGLPGREIVVQCPDAVVGLRRVTCDSRRAQKVVHLFDVQSLYAADVWDEDEARRFVDGCRVITGDR